MTPAEVRELRRSVDQAASRWIGATLHVARIEAMMTAGDLARRIGTSTRLVERYETGDVVPAPKTMRKIVEALPTFMPVLLRRIVERVH